MNESSDLFSDIIITLVGDLARLILLSLVRYNSFSFANEVLSLESNEVYAFMP